MGALLNLAMADDSVDAIVLDLDSGGGELAGLTDMAATLRSARQTKTIVAVANGGAKSVAY